MSIAGLFLVLALTNVDFDIVTVPPSGDVKALLPPAGRLEVKREGTVSRLKIDIDQITAPSAKAVGFNTYVVWAVSPEGVFDNLGELDVNRSKGQFSATTRLTEFGILISAEPHYMVDRPSSSVAYRSQTETILHCGLGVTRTEPNEGPPVSFSPLAPGFVPSSPSIELLNRRDHSSNIEILLHVCARRASDHRSARMIHGQCLDCGSEC